MSASPIFSYIFIFVKESLLIALLFRTIGDIYRKEKPRSQSCYIGIDPILTFKTFLNIHIGRPWPSGTSLHDASLLSWRPLPAGFQVPDHWSHCLFRFFCSGGRLIGLKQCVEFLNSQIGF